MNAFVITLVLCSTFMHAGWNLLARGHKLPTLFFGQMLLITIVAGLAPALVSEWTNPLLSPTAWWCVICSGGFCGMYYFFLGRSYESADFTTAYPVVRAVPVLLLGLGDVLRARPVSGAAWLGMVLVAGGCFLAPLRSFGDFHPGRYLRRSTVWMCLAALGTVGYSLADKIAAETVSPGPGTAARYCYFFFLFSGLAFFAATRAVQKIPSTIKQGSGVVLLVAALCNYGAYWLILWTYQLTRHVSYVVAFRQFSIIIGVVLAFVLYREKGLAVRLTGTVLITAGLVIIGLWGT